MHNGRKHLFLFFGQSNWASRSHYRGGINDPIFISVKKKTSHKLSLKRNDSKDAFCVGRQSFYRYFFQTEKRIAYIFSAFFIFLFSERKNVVKMSHEFTSSSFHLSLPNARKRKKKFWAFSSPDRSFFLFLSRALTTECQFLAPLTPREKETLIQFKGHVLDRDDDTC